MFDPNLCAGRIEKKSRPQVQRGWGAGMFGGVTFQLFNCFVVGLGRLEKPGNDHVTVILGEAGNQNHGLSARLGLVVCAFGCLSSAQE